MYSIRIFNKFCLNKIDDDLNFGRIYGILVVFWNRILLNSSGDLVKLIPYLYSTNSSINITSYIPVILHIFALLNIANYTVFFNNNNFIRTRGSFLLKI